VNERDGTEVDPELGSATGWYQDPYRLHELRWISSGRATRLVRDGDVNSSDVPPAEPFEGPLVAADEVPVRYETVRAGENGDPRIDPILIVYNSSM
jgi:hypothetical protein